MNEIGRLLTDWYRTHRILYPWRKTADPYRIWLSEILLQQTRIPVAIPYYRKILKTFPALEALASSESRDFLALWSGVGYYSRARNMHACARKLVREFSGQFPDDPVLLRSLPGIGPYTAAALLNLCFGKLTPALDGNVRRVLARLTANAMPQESREFARRAEADFLEFGAGTSPGLYFQALMELGERVCLPRPSCQECPVRLHCKAYRQGSAERLPLRRARSAAKKFHWYFLLLHRRNRWYLVRNPSREFLKDAWLFPDILTRRALTVDELQRRFKGEWSLPVQEIRKLGTVSHSVTFRRITCHGLVAECDGLKPARGEWVTEKEIDRRHTSSVVRKLLHLAAEKGY